MLKNRKVRKLLRDPKLFFKDMYLKKVNKKEEEIKEIPYISNNHFTIVSAAYNVSKYLDDYFNSIINQKLSFKDHIHIICVDDGSTDNTAEIIKNWQKKYPNNITYLHKENGGQASARNLGLEYVKTEWVTFIDPDDFLNAKYFFEIDAFLSKKNDKNIKLVASNFIFYFEEENKYDENHPLSYKFKNKENIHILNNLDNNIQLSASTALFSISNIIKNNIKFGENIKPNFEDAKFIGDYFLHLSLDKTKIVFLKESKYFYRKRSDGSSTLDTSWQQLGTFDDVLRHGCLEYLKNYQNKYGYIPYFVKNTILYHISWHIKYLINKPERVSFLNNNEKNEYLFLLDKIFSYYESSDILSYNPNSLWFFYKIGIISCFKNENSNYQISYINEVDKNKRQICLRYFSNQNNIASLKIDKKDIIPDFKKVIRHDFLNRTFIYEIRLWIYIPNDASNLEFFINEKTYINYQGKIYKTLKLSSLQNYFKIDDRVKEDIWLLMDRDIQADDNAEHLYRYIKDNHPEKNIYFALCSTSHDWVRLKKEGFNLVDFGTKECDDVFRSSSKIISSHADYYITNYLDKKSMLQKDYIFLQHGVIKDDLSLWLNSKNFQCFITATVDEYKSIVNNNTRYKFSKKEVKLTGLPRHDKLIKNNKKDNKKILIMPTWRQYILGSFIKDSNNKRNLNENILSTQYMIHWLSFLNSKKLQQLSKKYNYEIVFFPHINIQPYLPIMNIPDYIHVALHNEISIQELFQTSDFMITDYSSVAFDMAILDKTVLYYQFDESIFFNGLHSYQKGYFDYREDGFGPVVIDENNLLIELENILKNEENPSEKYQKRIDNTFKFKDTNNSKRVYEAIIELDAPYDESKKDKKLAIEWAEQAYKAEEWHLAYTRYQYLIEKLSVNSPEIEYRKENSYIHFFENILSELKDYGPNANYLLLEAKEKFLYKLAPEIKSLVNLDEVKVYFNEDTKNNIINLLNDIFSYIDIESIMKFNAKILWFYYKVGIIGAFKNETLPIQIAYISDFDRYNQEICIRFFSYTESTKNILFDGVETLPNSQMVFHHSLLNRLFLKEYKIWFSIPNGAKKLEFEINSLPVRINFNGKQLDSVSTDELNNAFINNSPQSNFFAVNNFTHLNLYSEGIELAKGEIKTALSLENWEYAYKRSLYIQEKFDINLSKYIEISKEGFIKENPVKYAEELALEGKYREAFDILKLLNINDLSTANEFNIYIRLANLNNEIELGKECIRFMLAKNINMNQSDWYKWNNILNINN